MKSVLSVSKKRKTVKSTGNKRTLRQVLTVIVILAGLLPAAAGCRSTKTYLPERSMAGYLPRGASIIGKIDVEKNRELFTRIVGRFLGAADELGPVFDRTSALFFSAEPSAYGRVDTSFVLLGDFPRGATSTMISGGDGWEKHFYGRIPWWENEAEQIQIAVPEHGLIFFASGEIEPMLDQYSSSFSSGINSEVLHEMEVSDFVLFLQKPAETLLGDFPVDLEKFPLKSLWFTMLNSMEKYYLSGAFLLGTTEEAEKMAMFSRILLVGWIRKNDLGDIGELKKTLTVEPAGNYVRLSGITLDQDAAERFIFSLLPEGGMVTQ